MSAGYSPHRLQQGNRFDHLALGEPALAFAQGQVGLNQLRQAQGAGGTRNTQRSGVRTGGLPQRPPVQDEGRLVQQGQASGHSMASTENLRCPALFANHAKISRASGNTVRP